jgi:hypothetical protein
MSVWPGPGRVAIVGSGRCGSILYEEPAGRLTLYWELGGADAG